MIFSYNGLECQFWSMFGSRCYLHYWNGWFYIKQHPMTKKIFFLYSSLSDLIIWTYKKLQNIKFLQINIDLNATCTYPFLKHQRISIPSGWHGPWMKIRHDSTVTSLLRASPWGSWVQGSKYYFLYKILVHFGMAPFFFPPSPTLVRVNWTRFFSSTVPKLAKKWKKWWTVYSNGGPKLVTLRNKNDCLW